MSELWENILKIEMLHGIPLIGNICFNLVTLI
jgi:hypothetical protein